MNLFPNPVFVWNEPEAFRLSEHRRSAVNTIWWLRPLVFFACVAMYMLAWEMAKHTPGKHPPDFIVAFPMIMGTCLFMLYVFPWLMRRCPGTVSLYSFGIIKMGDRARRVFKEMNGFYWSEEESYYVLCLVTKKGRTISYGVPDLNTRAKIEIVLRENGLSPVSMPVKPDFAARRKAIWGGRVFTSEEVKTMREEESPY